MIHPVKGIDHVLLMSKNLDDLASRYTCLGFTLSPRGQHPPAKGTANHTIMLGQDYIELLGILQRTELNRHRFDAVERDRPGLHAICCRVDNAVKAAAALEQLGIATEGLNSFDRPVPLPSGSLGCAAFSTLNFVNADTPVGLMFMCQHRTPETVWLPELMHHANSATGIAAIFTISSRPEEDAERFSRLFGDGAISDVAGGASVTTGTLSARLDLRRREALERVYPAQWLNMTPQGGHAVLQVRVAEVGRALACLNRASIPSLPTKSGRMVSPELAGGVVLEFIEE